ncbi:hypothetical protein [Croceiramulus getboli]|nr:hypothetical protein P8624_07695 [Flavobacteriaceae bacterium YJPT1-3]
MYKVFTYLLIASGLGGLFLGVSGMTFDVAMGINPWLLCIIGLIIFIAGFSHLLFITRMDNQ